MPEESRDPYGEREYGAWQNGEMERASQSLLCAWSGMALGTGSALAHRAVDSVLGSRHPEPAQAQAAAQQIAQEPNEPCHKPAKVFADCMSDSNGDLASCRYYFDKLQVRLLLPV